MIDQFIWIDRKKFERNLLYRAKLLRKLSAQSYHTVFQPTLSRLFYGGDAMVRIIKSRHKIGCEVIDYTVISKTQKRISDRYYSYLIPIKPSPLFEFYRNKYIAEQFLKKQCLIKKPTINRHLLSHTIDLPTSFICISPGARCFFAVGQLKNIVN